MSQIRVTHAPNGIEGLAIVQPALHGDARGYFCETYNERELREAGLTPRFVQDNQSRSTRGVLRGLHFQITHPQGKLVRAISGTIFDVAVDLRRASPTFGASFGLILSGENMTQLYIPEGFAHGFLVLSEEAVFAYKVTDFYRPGDEGGLLWNDAALGIAWPLEVLGGAKVQLNARDAANPPLRALRGE